MAEVVAIGELLIDFTEISKDSNGYPSFAAHPGGAPANFLAALSKYGISTSFIGKIGSDTFGQLLKNTISEFGIGTEDLIIDDSFFTTLAFVTLDENGDRIFAFSRKPGADTCINENEIDYNLIDNASVLHFGTLSLTAEPSRSACKNAVKYAISRNKIISFDPNLRMPLWNSEIEAKNQFLWGIERADILKLSDDELWFYFNLKPKDGIRYIFETYKNVKLLFITCGADGVYYANRNCCGFVSSLKDIKVIDTTGAGDIFGGSVLSVLLKSGNILKLQELPENKLKEAVVFATAAAGLSTAKYGGISSIAEYNEVLEKIKQED